MIAFACSDSETSNGDKFFDDGQYPEAIAAYSDYLANSPEHSKSLYNRGRAYEEIGSSAKAKADFERIIEIDAKNINAYLSLAKLSYNGQNFNEVLIYAGKAIELNENSAQAHFLAGRGAHQLGYFKQAIESYNNAISINKDFGEAYLYRGAVKIGLEKGQSACEDFKFAKLLDVPGAEKAIKDYCK